MRKNIGILHVYLKSPRRPETYIVGDEQGLYDLWKAVEGAMIGRKGQSAFRTAGKGTGTRDFIVLRVDGESSFLKRFKMGKWG